MSLPYDDGTPANRNFPTFPNLNCQGAVDIGTPETRNFSTAGEAAAAAATAAAARVEIRAALFAIRAVDPNCEQPANRNLDPVWLSKIT